MKNFVTVIFLLIFVAMIWLIVAASLDRSVFEAGSALWPDPWFKTTLFDAYFAFIAVWLIVVAREDAWPARLCWLVAFLGLGSLAIAAYFLWALLRLPQGADWRQALLGDGTRSSRASGQAESAQLTRDR